MRIPPNFGRSAVIVVALLAAGFFAAYLRFAPYLSGGNSYTDGRSEQALSDVDSLRFAVWDSPELLPGDINTEGSEGRATTTPDGRYLVFTVGDEGLNANLWRAELVDGEPVRPRPLTRLNTSADELAPAMSGDALYFASNRSGGEGGFDLYKSLYTNGVFGPVLRLDEGLNTRADETDPAPVPGMGSGFAAGDQALTFASNRRRGQRTDYDLYTATPASSLSTRVAEAPAPESGWLVETFDVLNTPFDERDPVYTTHGRGLLYASNRSDGAGDFDLWRSVQNLDAWQPPESVPGLNTTGVERAPLPSADGFSLMFVGAPTADGSSDLYRARSLELFRLPGRPIGWLDLTILGLLLLLALLAWLGKRWETLDVLYKCLLVSLLVHAGMMLWFREVLVEPEDVELGTPSPSFKVRMAPSRESLSRSKERAGEVEVSRGAIAEAAAPGKQAMQVAESDPQLAEAADRTAAARSEDLAQPELAAADAPSRASAEFVRSEQSESRATDSAVSVAQPQASEARHSAEAPSLAVNARAVSSPPAEPSSLTAAARPAREATASAAPASATQQTAAGPTHVSLGLPSTVSAVPTPGRRQVAVRPERRPATDGGAALELSGPAALPSAAESGASTELGAPPSLELTAVNTSSSAADGSARPSPTAPARPSRISTQGTDSDGADSLSAQSPGSSPLADAGEDRPSNANSLLTEGLVGSAASRSTPQTRRQASGVQPPTRRTPTEVALSRGSFDSGGQAASTFANLAPDGASLSVADLASRAAAEASALAAAQAETDALLLEGLASSTPSSSSRSRGSSSPSSPGRPQRFAARDTDASSATTSALSTPDAPAFVPLVVAAPAPTKLPERDAQQWDNTPYRTRFGEAKLEAIEEFGGNEETEAAVAAGLAYLAKLQSPKGQWGSTDDYDDKYGHVAVGKTALCMLAFLGAGHTPESRTQYSHVTERAVDFLLGTQEADSGHFGYSTSYSHGITTYALAETYALTKDSRLRRPLQRAVAWILENQSHVRDSRMFGGWAYYYPDGHTYDRWPRTSITAWQVMALESARLGGLTVPDKAFEDAASFLRAAHRRDRGVLLYNHDPDRLRSTYWTLPGSTPAGLFALSLLGENIESSTYSSVNEWILERAPNGYRNRGQDSFVHQATGNLYFWYYGTLALFRQGGTAWDAWNRRLQDTLLPSQERDGSWTPISTYADYAGDDRNDRAYTTAMCVLTLEIYYRYFTPLLKVEPK